MSARLEVADIFRRHGEAYRQAHDGHLGRVERRVMSAIELCRSAELGGHVEGCRSCGAIRVAYNSCRNRHCPKCQGQACREWLAARQGELLPVPYFHVVFTLPAQIAAIAFQNKAAVYTMLFKATAETLRTIAADSKHLGAEIGLVGVLHSWGQNLHYHPHIHCIVPGGGLSPDGTRWISCRPGFFLPVRVLSRLFRRLFLEELRTAYEAGKLSFFGDLAELALPAVFRRRLGEARRLEWVVYAKPPFGGPEQVLAYLGRYTHRVAIANSRLVSIADGKIVFRGRDYRQGGKAKLMTLDVHEFIR
ncbi:IS91 family transposase, partial [Mesorhizobium shangrilense]